MAICPSAVSLIASSALISAILVSRPSSCAGTEPSSWLRLLQSFQDRQQDREDRSRHISFEFPIQLGSHSICDTKIVDDFLQGLLRLVCQTCCVAVKRVALECSNDSIVGLAAGSTGRWKGFPLFVLLIIIDIVATATTATASFALGSVVAAHCGSFDLWNSTRDNTKGSHKVLNRIPSSYLMPTRSSAVVLGFCS